MTKREYFKCEECGKYYPVFHYSTHMASTHKIKPLIFSKMYDSPFSADDLRELREFQQKYGKKKEARV